MSTPPVNSCNSSAGLIEKYINSAYDNVKTVADNLDFLHDLYEFLIQYGLTTNIAVKAPVQIVSMSPITLAGNQTISWSAHSGDYTVAAVTGNRVLVMGQTNPVENGIYNVQIGAWTRAVDFDGPLDVVDGTLVFSAQGDAWQVDGPQYALVPGVDAITFKDIDLFAFSAVQEATAKAAEAAASAAAALASKQAASTSETNAAVSEANAAAKSANADSAAIASANSASQSAAYALDASNSATDAANSASLAESVAENDRTFADVPAGLAGTTSGQYFRVPQGTGADMAFLYYLNNAGAAVAVAETVGYAAYVKQAAEINDVTVRTDGLKTQGYSTYPYEVVDVVLKLLHAIDDTGKHLMPGGIKTKSLEVTDEVNFADMNVRTITPYNINSESSIGDYAYVETDNMGKALFGTLSADGRKVYLGEILHNRAALPYGDFYAIGDSITANGVTYFDSTRKYESFNDLSWHVWGMLLSKGRMRFAGASATGGYTSAQILAQHLPNALKSGASFCVVMCGRNDVNMGINIDTVTIPNMQEIFRQLRRAGIIPVVCTMSAHGNSGFDSKRVAEHKINAWLRAYATQHKLPFVDLHKATVNPLTGDWLPGYNQDVSHPTNMGAYYMGKALYDGMLDWTAKVYPTMADEQLPDNTLGTNLIANSLFLKTTGNMPDDWVLSTAGVSSLRAAASGEGVVGNVWEQRNQTSTLTINVTPGQKVGFGFMVKNDSATGSFSFTCAGIAGSGLQNLAGLRDWKYHIPDWSYFYYEFTVPSDQTSMTFTLATGSSTVSIAQLGLFKISEV